MPVSSQQERVEEGVAKLDRVVDFVPRIVEEFDVAAQQAVAQTEGRGGKLVGDAWVHPRVVAPIGRQGAGPSRAGKNSL